MQLDGSAITQAIMAPPFAAAINETLNGTGAGVMERFSVVGVSPSIVLICSSRPFIRPSIASNTELFTTSRGSVAVPRKKTQSLTRLRPASVVVRTLNSTLFC